MKLDRKKLDNDLIVKRVLDYDVRDIGNLVEFIDKTVSPSFTAIIAQYLSGGKSTLQQISFIDGNPHCTQGILEELERKLNFANRLGLIENGAFSRYVITEKARKEYFFD